MKKIKNLKFSNFIFIFILIVFILLRSFILYWGYVPSSSMEKTISENSYILGNRLAYLNKEPARDDIIVFKYPIDQKTNFVKRIIGLPGELVTIENGQVYINHEPINEAYINGPWINDNTNYSFQVPDNAYFVMGDNRNNSLDARYWKDVAASLGYQNPEKYTFVYKENILAKIIWYQK